MQCAADIGAPLIVSLYTSTAAYKAAAAATSILLSMLYKANVGVLEILKL
jgi:hypothetical protein